MRHSFTSYHLAKYRNLAETINETGHLSPQMVHRHYKELVSPHDAALYWVIIPAGNENTGAWGVAFDFDNKDVVCLPPEKRAEAQAMADFILKKIRPKFPAAA